MTDSPAQAQQHFTQAQSLEDQQKFGMALAECETAIHCDPEFADAYNLRAIILEDLGRTSEAILDYREALEIDPNFQEARDNLSEVVSRLQGQPSPASPVIGYPFGKRIGKRTLAAIVDYGFITVIYTAVQNTIGAVTGVASISDVEKAATIESLIANCLFLISGAMLLALYVIAFEWICGATVGKFVLGLRVVKDNGEPCDFRAAFIRAVLLPIDSLRFSFPSLIRMSAPLYQRLGDKAAQTIVVDAKSSFVQEPISWRRFLVVLSLYLIANILFVLLFAMAPIR